jgi:hypothetical protein
VTPIPLTTATASTLAADVLSLGGGASLCVSVRRPLPVRIDTLSPFSTNAMLGRDAEIRCRGGAGPLAKGGPR